MAEWSRRCIFVALFASFLPGQELFVYAHQEDFILEGPHGDGGNFNFKVEVGNRTTPTTFSWEYPSIEFDKFLLRLELISNPPGERHVDRVQDFFTQDTTLSIGRDLLLPGATYSAKLFTQIGEEISSSYEEANFTLNPIPPERLILWFKNTTALLFIWEPPTGIFKEYKVTISPPDSSIDTLHIPRDLYQKGEATANLPGFVGLVPGRTYTISLSTVTSDLVESSHTLLETRTLPVEVSNVTVSLLDPSRIIVEWIPPEEGDYDGFSVLLKADGYSSPLQKKFIPREKEQSQAILELEKPLDHLQDEMSPRRLFITVQTVSGRIHSHSTPQYFPL